MNLKTEKRLKALIGYPLTLFLGLIESDEKEIKRTDELRELFKDRIFGKRLL